MRHKGKCNNYIHIKGRLQRKLEDCKISQTETRKNLTMLMKSDQIRVTTHLRNLFLKGWTYNSYPETSGLNQNFYSKQNQWHHRNRASSRHSGFKHAQYTIASQMKEKYRSLCGPMLVSLEDSDPWKTMKELQNKNTKQAQEKLFQGFITNDLL